MSGHDNLVYLHGFVGRPEVKTTSKGEVLTFGLGQSTSYEENAPVVWHSIEVWNEELRAALDLTKGDKVAVVGFVNEREYEGKTYRSIRATQVGSIEFAKKASKGLGGL